MRGHGGPHPLPPSSAKSSRHLLAVQLQCGHCSADSTVSLQLTFHGSQGALLKSQSHPILSLPFFTPFHPPDTFAGQARPSLRSRWFLLPTLAGHHHRPGTNQTISGSANTTFPVPRAPLPSCDPCSHSRSGGTPPYPCPLISVFPFPRQLGR